MTSLTTFYLSGIIGKEAFGSDGDAIGVIRDLLISAVPTGQNDPSQQLVTGVKLKTGRETKFFSFSTFRVVKAREALKLEFPELSERVTLHLPDEKSKRVGQAVAAASFTSPRAWINSAGKPRPEMGKFCTARCVWAP